MADTNFIEVYMPSYVELQQQTLYSTRERLVGYMRTKFDDVDLVPNTVVGDLIVTPQTWTMTAMEEGLDRVFSDLNTANIADNIVYNCDFVTSWLKNFVNGTVLSRPASGVVRITFSSADPIALDRSTQFTIGDNIFTLYMPNTGGFLIVPPGEDVPPGANGSVLVDTGSGSYYCDLPVVGETNLNQDADTAEAVAAGAQAAPLLPIEGMTAAVALTEFDAGFTSYSPRQMAKLAQTTVYAASMNTRNGAIRYITEVCPFVESVYPIVNGERELLREYHNSYGTSSGCMDLYVRSKSYEFTEEQTVRLYLNEAQTAYEGPWNYAGQPYHVESITHSARPDIADIPHSITSSNNQGLGALAAYTPYEKLTISIEDVHDSNGDSIFSPRIDENGKRYAEFTIRYQTDPALRAVAQVAESSDNKPINTSLLVRGFIPVIIDQFEVSYVREEGVVPNLASALDNIKIYLAGIGAPNTYSDGEIARIMKQAGAKYIKDISVRARVQWSVADKIVDFRGTMTDVPTAPEINTSAGLRVEYPAPSYQITATDMYACSVRNIRYYLMENSVTFNEVKEM